MARILLLILPLFLSAATFTPPPRWKVSEEAGDFILQAKCKAKGRIAPNAVLTSEPFFGTCEEYVACVKERNRHYSGGTVHSIRTEEQSPIQTKAGPARMLKLDLTSSLGEATFFQAVVVADGEAFILTVGSSKECFANHIGDFVRLIRSFTLNENLAENNRL